MNSSEIDELIRENDRSRRAFVEEWADYVRTHDDEEWSRQQNRLIDSQLQAARNVDRSPEEYLERKRTTSTATECDEH